MELGTIIPICSHHFLFSSSSDHLRLFWNNGMFGARRTASWPAFLPSANRPSMLLATQILLYASAYSGRSSSAFLAATMQSSYRFAWQYVTDKFRKFSADGKTLRGSFWCVALFSMVVTDRKSTRLNSSHLG